MDKFAYIAKHFVEQGFDVIGMDYKGFGHSGGARGFIGNRDHFYDDGYQFIVKARKFYEQLFPETALGFFTMGYSQGSALALGIARRLKEAGDAPLAGQIYVVPNFRIQMDHWTEEFRAELAANCTDPSKHILFPAKPLKDFSFLMGYIADELQFKGPHYAVTLEIIKEVSDVDREYFKEITHPVYITLADGDNILDNSEIKRFYDTIATPAHLKEIKGYDSDHYILSDGWLYEEVIADQIAWLNKLSTL